ncbi:sugar phosphate nucleotidyltransferase [Paenibacillus puerhi]|uniref:sugar phosphate nucleotidyltransferase n=1 Tax=Paenibacillus puerhi TaxID=2692622 RepID=UPI00135B9460|nr:sugar phosphate nucleotidyltransferase [Paenibacillus puerhi]
MRIVLLSGGSGKRLWPLSNEIRSKAFLKLLPAEGGGQESMIQRVCRQLDAAGLLSSTAIVAHQSQLELIQNHVGDRLPVISEPCKRGTYTAIALASAYLHTEQKAGPEETLCVLPVDSFADPAFFQLMHAFPSVLAESGADLALLGTVPGHPSSQFGYILPATVAGEARSFFPVDRFVEKPDERQASDLIRAHALWNCGVFAFPLKFMLAELKKKGLPSDHKELLHGYEQLPDLSFDQEIVENCRQAAVIPYHGLWKDLGSWEALTNHVGSRVIGSGQVSADSVNTHLINELSYPIQIIDVPNIIVAASPDGILVASKMNASRIKEKLTNTPQLAKYAEKRWGTFRVLDHIVAENGVEVVTGKMQLIAGKHTSYHKHSRRTESWTVASGIGEMILEDRLLQLQTGDMLQIPCGASHGVRAVTSLEVIQIQVGSGLWDEEDTDRIATSWEDALQRCRKG